MKNSNFYLGTRKKENRVYLIYNITLNAYKFGITSKSIEERIDNYCNDKSKFCFTNIINENVITYQYEFTKSNIKVLFNKEFENAEKIEKKLSLKINGCRLKLKGQQYQFREHFTGEDKAKEILDFLHTIT